MDGLDFLPTGTLDIPDPDALQAPVNPAPGLGRGRPGLAEPVDPNVIRFPGGDDIFAPPATPNPPPDGFGFIDDPTAHPCQWGGDCECGGACAPDCDQAQTDTWLLTASRCADGHPVATPPLATMSIDSLYSHGIGAASDIAPAVPHQPPGYWPQNPAMLSIDWQVNPSEPTREQLLAMCRPSCDRHCNTLCEIWVHLYLEIRDGGLTPEESAAKTGQLQTVIMEYARCCKRHEDSLENCIRECDDAFEVNLMIGAAACTGLATLYFWCLARAIGFATAKYNICTHLCRQSFDKYPA
jgi:hypothetical protein